MDGRPRRANAWTESGVQAVLLSRTLGWGCGCWVLRRISLPYSIRWGISFGWNYVPEPTNKALYEALRGSASIKSVDPSSYIRACRPSGKSTIVVPSSEPSITFSPIVDASSPVRLARGLLSRRPVARSSRTLRKLSLSHLITFSLPRFTFILLLQAH